MPDAAYAGDWPERRARILLEEPWCVGYPIGAHEDEPPVRTTTVDHIIPVIEGGTSDRSNLRGLCRTCNSRKGQREGRSRDTSPRRTWRS